MITDAGAIELAKLKKLQRLFVGGFVSTAGVHELASIPSLQQLGVSTSIISTDDVERLRETIAITFFSVRPFAGDVAMSGDGIPVRDLFAVSNVPAAILNTQHPARCARARCARASHLQALLDVAVIPLLLNKVADVFEILTKLLPHQIVLRGGLGSLTWPRLEDVEFTTAFRHPRRWPS